MGREDVSVSGSNKPEKVGDENSCRVGHDGDGSEGKLAEGVSLAMKEKSTNAYMVVANSLRKLELATCS